MASLSLALPDAVMRQRQSAAAMLRQDVEQLAQLDDLEDLALAKSICEDIDAGRTTTQNLDEVIRELGLDDPTGS